MKFRGLFFSCFFFKSPEWHHPCKRDLATKEWKKRKNKSLIVTVDEEEEGEKSPNEPPSLPFLSSQRGETSMKRTQKHSEPLARKHCLHVKQL